MKEPPSQCAPVSIPLRGKGTGGWNGTTASLAALNIAAEGPREAGASKCSVKCRQSAVPEIAAVSDPHKRAANSSNIADYLAAGTIDPGDAVDSNLIFAANVGVAKFGLTTVEHFDGEWSTASLAGGFICRITAFPNNRVRLPFDRWMPIFPWKKCSISEHALTAARYRSVLVVLVSVPIGSD